MNTGKTTYFQIENFEKEGEFDVIGSECTINSSTFVKKDTLKHHQIKQALDTCNELNSLGVQTIIVKSEEELTIWVEKGAESKKSTEAEATQNYNQQGLPTKTVTRRYRGQVYEETVVDWAAIQNTNQPQKQIKYRGRSIS